MSIAKESKSVHKDSETVPYLMMKRAPSSNENLYSEMESKETNETGIYELVGANDNTPTKETAFVKHSSKYRMALSTESIYSSRSDTVTVQRILIIVIGVVLVSFLTAVTTLILAVYNVSARNTQSIDCGCAAVQDQTPSSSSGKLVVPRQPTKENMSSSSVEKNSIEIIITEIEEMKKKYEQLKAKCNTSALWQSIKSNTQDMMQEIMRLDQKMLNISATQGPRGPPGFNGTQGPRGYNGTQGAPGISPAGGDLTLCNYQEKKSSETIPGAYAAADVSITETNGKKIIGANCATNDAKVVLLSSTETGGARTYRCECTGTQNTGESKMYCAVHFWEC